MPERIYPKRIALDLIAPSYGPTYPNQETEFDIGYRRMPGYHMTDEVGLGWTKVRMGDNSVYVRNREFSRIDGCFNSLISAAITDRIGEKSGPVKVLDVGGGVLSVAARQIAERFGADVKVTNLDVVLSEQVEDTDNFQAVLGDARQMPFPDDEFDVIYSWQLLPNVMHQKRIPMQGEIDRVLAFGGATYIDGGAAWQVGGNAFRHLVSTLHYRI